mmetsp:Transcript_23669/g.51768  ORF Transcript_23669/g.51768 Transcript_23669/m.51768 type:complete len:92 (-) Transcript_23669:204-479(-)|eukprot:CAMPEP_0206498480 /NCGR_PEP_ID=MMETSP0324_2-20121206/51028_1 /ASSEMBLY_ACC=CAM_ASM_000836 /TAXON_ID=2866 /ORGANISM="Crypthecodinium cohnii, Strain Seligo" /LENGTH=91 /DNA_ID=CAMNT_0053984693 /DNA_START=326 /DNA_END=601 /DNA_ORIENTATION=+
MATDQQVVKMLDGLAVLGQLRKVWCLSSRDTESNLNEHGKGVLQHCDGEVQTKAKAKVVDFRSKGAALNVLGRISKMPALLGHEIGGASLS